jgi:hypothetical protein
MRITQNVLLMDTQLQQGGGKSNQSDQLYLIFI